MAHCRRLPRAEHPTRADGFCSLPLRRVVVHRLARDILGEKTDWSAATRSGVGGVTPKFYGAVREQHPRGDPVAASAGGGGGGAVGSGPLAAAASQAAAAGAGDLASPSGGGAHQPPPGWAEKKLAFYGSLPSPKRALQKESADGRRGSGGWSRAGGGWDAAPSPTAEQQLRHRGVGAKSSQ